ncbi:Ferrichrome outer membrane transporter/phage receptor [Usitatibacter rugosus]|uniref:Ferrichrome outer membrane transporter/phage receptor n=1 Tax=Usitatibacter rugosus TaxID=2732067 RepID=A0A6M4GQA3_9PROT|nr:TonB-dependent siderophore receptor [Usitatibacter rugosus]QJR09520.1 Ferrichrome outer membrane transporter/phage receptor [Usitatibacter rugosus]
MRRSPFPLVVLSALFAHSAFAQQSPPKEQTLPEVKVTAAVEETATGPVGGYNAKRSSTATKTDTPLAETPQSVTVVTRERIEEMGATNLQDALNYAAGVRPDAFGVDSRSDGVLVRGGYPDEYRDGLRRLFGYYTSTARVDPYALERIEVLRGPSAMLYGQGTTAGIINMVSKRPLAENFREIGVQYGTWDRKQVMADLTGPLTSDGKWLYRITGLLRESDTQVDYVPDDRKMIAPALTWKPNSDFTITFLANWQKDETGSTLQFFPWQAVRGPNPNGQVPTSRFIGEPGFDRYDTERSEAGWTLDYKLNRDWTFHQTARYSRNENEYFTLYSDSFTSPGNVFLDPAQRVIDRFGEGTIRKNSLVAADQNLEGKIRHGIFQHTLLAGVDALRFREESKSASNYPPVYGGTVPPIDIYNPIYTGFDVGPLADLPKTKMRSIGVYLQDQVKIDKHWIVVAGVRHDEVTSSVEGLDDDKDDATTYRAGLMYLTDSGWSPYVSYSESFTPMAGINTTTLDRFKPLRGEQYEVGVKFQPANAPYSFTAAAYNLKEENRVLELTPGVVTQVGETKTKGVELELAGRILSALDVVVNYNWIDNDEQLDTLPKNQFSAWGTYRFTGGMKGLSAGLGVRYLSSFKDKSAPVTPSNTLVDAMIAWDTGPWRFAINGQNLADKIYASTCLDRGDCFYGARRTIVGSVFYRF